MSLSRREIAEARVGRTLRGKWRLDALIGVGGMASVYAATHRNGKRGAVKMLHPEVAIEPSLRERFLREGRAANAIAHPGVVSVLDDDEDETGSPFLVMELLSGRSSAERASEAGGRLPWAEVRPIAEGLADALSAAHAAGVVHRDVKPDNVFLCDDGKVKLLDFGIARGDDGSTQTQVGDLMGTPAFMAPEQAMGLWHEVGPASDVWAAGATIFSLLAGRNVHEGKNRNEALVLAATREAPSIVGLCEIPDSVAKVIDRALSREASSRHADGHELREALAKAVHDAGEPPSAPLPPRSAPRASPAPPRPVAYAGDDTLAPVRAVEIARPAEALPTQISAGALPAASTPALSTEQPRESAAAPRRGMTVPVALAVAVIAALLLALWRFSRAPEAPQTTDRAPPSPNSAPPSPNSAPTPPNSAPPPGSAPPPPNSAPQPASASPRPRPAAARPDPLDRRK